MQPSKLSSSPDFQEDAIQLLGVNGLRCNGMFVGLNTEGYRRILPEDLEHHFSKRQRTPKSEAFSEELDQIFTHSDNAETPELKRFLLLFDLHGQDENGRVLRRLEQGIKGKVVTIANRFFLRRLLKKDNNILSNDKDRWCVFENPKRDLVYLVPLDGLEKVAKKVALIAGHGSAGRWVEAKQLVEKNMATLPPAFFQKLLLHMDQASFDVVSCTSCGSGKSSLWSVVHDQGPLPIHFPFITHCLGDYGTRFPLKIDLNRYFDHLERVITTGSNDALKAFGRLTIARKSAREEPIIYVPGFKPKPMNPLRRLFVIEHEHTGRIERKERIICLYAEKCLGELALTREDHKIPRLVSMIPLGGVHFIQRLIFTNSSLCESVRVGLGCSRLSYEQKKRHQIIPYKKAHTYAQVFFLGELQATDGTLSCVMVVPAYKNLKGETVAGNFCLSKELLGWRLWKPIIPETKNADNETLFVSDAEAKQIVIDICRVVNSSVDINYLYNQFWPR